MPNGTNTDLPKWGLSKRNAFLTQAFFCHMDHAIERKWRQRSIPSDDGDFSQEKRQEILNRFSSQWKHCCSIWRLFLLGPTPNLSSLVLSWNSEYWKLIDVNSMLQGSSDEISIDFVPAMRCYNQMTVLFAPLQLEKVCSWYSIRCRLPRGSHTRKEASQFPPYRPFPNTLWIWCIPEARRKSENRNSAAFDLESAQGERPASPQSSPMNEDNTRDGQKEEDKNEENMRGNRIATTRSQNLAGSHETQSQIEFRGFRKNADEREFQGFFAVLTWSL